MVKGHRSRVAALLLHLVVLPACAQSYVMHSVPDAPVGGRTAWVELRRAHHNIFAPCPASRSVSFLGSFAIDLPSLTATFRSGGEDRSGGPTDEEGNAYRGEPAGEDTSAGSPAGRLVRYDRSGQRTPLGPGPEAGTLGNVSVAVDGGETFVFFQRRRWQGNGTDSVGRVRVATGEVLHLGMPTDVGPDPESWVWDYLFPVDCAGVVLVGRRMSDERGKWHFRTWRGEFGRLTWGPAIEGAFRPIDRQGTLLEIREDRWLAPPTGLSDFSAEVIRDGRREVVNLGFAGDADLLFDTGCVVLWDGESEEVVLRPLFGGAERRFGR
ncbi:MAG: hypothetical protein MUE73_10485 [Planctomycetes bacterium]|jgi:hypothetical protein|nr:hypothetical protein [Planctomycetota bacterium]